MSDQDQPKNKGGQPTLLTPATQKTICDTISMGLTQEDAAAAAGIHPETIRLWQAKGRAGDPVYSGFFAAMAKAKITGKMADLGVVSKAALGGDWKASAWRLERKFPKEFAPRVVISIQEELDAGMFRLREFFAALPADRMMGPDEALELALSALAGEGAPPEAAAAEGGGDGGPGGPPVGSAPAEPGPT